MSLSTPIIYTSLPSTVSRSPIHDGRADQAEQIKLMNELRKHAAAVYELVFDFETNGDAVPAAAWACQLPDGVTWYAVVEATATSGTGDSAYWRRDSLINRNGTVSVVFDANTAHAATANLITFDASWTVDNLYAVLTLTDAVGFAGKWRIRLKVQAVTAS